MERKLASGLEERTSLFLRWRYIPYRLSRVTQQVRRGTLAFSVSVCTRCVYIGIRVRWPGLKLPATSRFRFFFARCACNPFPHSAPSRGRLSGADIEVYSSTYVCMYIYVYDAREKSLARIFARRWLIGVEDSLSFFLGLLSRAGGGL